LLKELLKKVSEISASLGYDAFGRIYEYFLGEFARTVGPNMFYTVTLPCTLWFLDKGKGAASRKDTVLFIDARHIYRQIDRAHRDWTSAQIGFIANIVRLYRAEELDFTLGGV
jgi:type I restriction enzyme M protein